MQVLPPFEGPRLKIRRAVHHIADLHEIFDDLTKGAGMGWVPVHDHGQNIEYCLVLNRELPEDAPVIIGDAIHCLRAALDLLICDIARMRGLPTDHLKFPFAKTEPNFSKILRKEIAPIGQDLADAIEPLKPYTHGNADLVGLHDLDIADKHVTILPTYLAAPARMTGLPGMINDIMRGAVGFGIDQIIHHYAVGQRVHVVKGTHPNDLFTPHPQKLQPCFPKGLPFEREPVLFALNRLAQMVDEIVEDFAEKFAPPSSDEIND